MCQTDIMSGIIRFVVFLGVSVRVSECTFPVRLRNGGVASEGRVEIFNNNQWGTVCDDGWNVKAAIVVCRSLGYGSGRNVEAVSRATFGSGSGAIWLDDVVCTGNETAIDYCHHKPLGRTNCGHNEDAGVRCRTDASNKIRLVGGNSSREGRVEIFIQQRSTWGTVCDDRWDFNDASVVCHQLGFARSPAIPVSSAYFGQGRGVIWYDETACTGQESGLSNCTASKGHTDCSHTEDAGVICVSDNSTLTIDDIRLRGGRSEYEGRLEVNILGHWGTVCFHGLNVAAAQVACKMLGWSGGRLTSIRIGATNGPIFLSDVRCTGREPSLLNCGHKPLGENTCRHNTDVAISCTPVTPVKLPIRLVGGSSQYEGRVEVMYQGTWGTVCDDSWDARDAAVVCRMLNFSVAGAVAVSKHGFGMGTGPIMLDDVQCLGTESNLDLCNISQWKHTNCDHSEDAGVICQPPGTLSVNVSVRLAGGPDPHSGRLEVLYKNRWGTVCDDGFSMNDAKVVCRMLGFLTDNMTVFQGSHFGAGTGPIHLDDVVCSGSESSIALCGNRGWGRSNCGHAEDVSMACAGGPATNLSIRLAGGRTSQEGRVEVMHNGQWGTVCDNHWDVNAATVVCRMLRLPLDGAQPRGGSFFGPGSGNVLLGAVACDGNETSLELCDHAPWLATTCSQSRQAGVICGALPRVPIRLRGGSTTSEGRVEVYLNHTWGTICDDLFGPEEATVICKMLGFNAPLASAVPEARYGPGTGPILLDDLTCLGSETNILQCASKGVGRSNCNHNEDVGVLCEQDSVRWRLANGTSSSGRLEVYMFGQWGTVCDDSFNGVSAQVACRTLGLSSLNARAVPAAHFGRGTGSITLDDVICRGTERSLLDCRHSAFMHSNCQHSEDVGVICGSAPQVNSSSVRLVNGNSSSVGRVEVFYNGAWGTVCDDGFNTAEAQVVCKWLGIDFAQAVAKPNGEFGSGQGRIVLDDVRCAGTEASLFDCRHRSLGSSNCRHNEDVGVQCISAASLDSSIRLVNGSSSRSGRVEINHGGHWGTICDDSWGLHEAAVVCRQLGFNNANGIPVPEAYFGAGTGTIFLDETACTGNESQLTYCPHDPWGRNDCEHGEDAGVICLSGSSTSPLRTQLVGGISANQGRVEFRYHGVWGTVCDDNFDNLDAAVICRMLGFPRGGRTLDSGVGSGRGPVWIDEVHCLGNEESISNCTGFQWGENDCDHSEDAGVYCFPDVNFNFTVRLANGPTPLEGRVEILYNRTWHSVCDDEWSAADAAVVCRMLNLGTDGATAVGNAAYGRGTGSILLDDVVCRGTESNLAQCQSGELGMNNCDHSEDAGVRCSQAGQVTSGIKVRLVNGPNPRAGRVEVFYNNVWGTVCDDHWDNRAAQVVCRMLGFPTDGALARVHAFFRQGTGVIQLDDVNCIGNETSLALCGHRRWRTSDCQHSEDAGVVCPGGDAHPTHARLVGGLRSNEGRVELFYNNTWGTVCDDGFGVEEAQVVCRSLGYSVEGARSYSSAHFGRGTGQILYDDLRCRGTEASLDICYHRPVGQSNCNHGEDAGVLCPAGAVSRTAIRLVHGSGPSQGRVEIQVNGTWGTICDDLFTSRGAGVVCAMLGFQRTGAIVKIRGYFGRGSGPIYLDDVQCNGREASIFECPAKPIGQANCNHGEDVGVICVAESVSVRLVGGSSRYEGRLELNINGTWGTVCDDNFGRPDAVVACRMLGFPTAGARINRVRRTGTGQIWLDDLGCYGSETSLLQCRRRRGPLGSNDCSHTEDVSVICSAVPLITTPRPTIRPITRFPQPDPHQVFVRLAGGGTSYEGRVEVFFSNTFGTVCDDFWTINSSQVICGMLGYSRSNAMVKLSTFSGPVPGRTWLDDVKCRGSEALIAQCPSAPWGTENCQHSEDVGVVCSSAQRPDNFFLLVEGTTGMIYRMDHRTFSYVSLPPIPHRASYNNPVAIDYDPVEGHIYWSDVRTKQILSSNLDGTDLKILVQLNSASVPDGLAVDPLSRNLYFTDQGNQVITAMSLDGFAQRTIIKDNLQKPRAIAVHPYQGLMFWTDWGTSPKIERSQMDGADRRTIVSTGLKWPNGIAIDYRASRIYWCDAGTLKIESANFLGQSRRTIVQTQASQLFGITLTDSNVFYTDWNSTSLMTVSKSGSQPQMPVGPPSFGLMNGVVYQRKRFGITGTTGCSKGRGGCSHLCIPRPRMGKVCVCPDSLTLQPDGVSCSTDVPCPALTSPIMGEFIPENCTSGNSSVGTVCNATCRAGFSLIGPSRVTCLGTGQWSHSGSLLVCRDTQAPNLTCPADITTPSQKGSTSATVTWTIPTVTDNGGGTVQTTQSMHSPAHLKEGRYTVFVSATDGRGLSSSCTFSIIVTVNRCPPLVLPTGAYLTTPFCPLYHGSNCSVQCSRGYQSSSQSQQQVTCDQTQGGVLGWTTNKISCKPVVCQPLKVPHNSAVTGCTPPFSVGTGCIQKCNQGYQQTSGTSSRRCNMGGNWTGTDIVCTSAPTCPTLTSPSNGVVSCQAPYTVGKLCIQRCNSGFAAAAGTTIRQCQSSGTWSGLELQCRGVGFCQALTPPGNGKVSGCVAPLKTGTICSQSCSNGFIQTGGTITRQCLQSGTWSGSSLTCVTPPSCPQLQAPANGSVKDCPVTSPVGGLCVQSCNHGYKMSSGSPIRQCQKNGSWSGQLIVCSWHNTSKQAGSSSAQTGTRPGTQGPGTGGGTGPAITVLGVFVGFLILAAIVVGVLIFRKRSNHHSNNQPGGRRKTYALRPTDTYDDRSVFDQGPGLVNPMYGDADGAGL